MQRQSMIAIQDEYIARVLTCTTGHLRRVRRGARNAAFGKLNRLGYSPAQQRMIVADADDMAKLERNAVDDDE